MAKKPKVPPEPVSDAITTLLLTALREEEVNLINADEAMKLAETEFAHWQNRVDALRKYIAIVEANPVEKDEIIMDEGK